MKPDFPNEHTGGLAAENPDAPASAERVSGDSSSPESGSFHLTVSGSAPAGPGYGGAGTVADVSADPDGDALLDVLSKERPLAPEEIPDIFAPPSQAMPGDFLHLGGSGGGNAAGSARGAGGSASGVAGSVSGTAGSASGTAGAMSDAGPAPGAVGTMSGAAGTKSGTAGEKKGWNTDTRTGIPSAPWRSTTARQDAGGFAGAPINPHWGQTGGTGVAYSSGGAGSPPGGAGGAWVWLPEGMQPPKSWRKRHPVLFWGCIILAAMTVFGWGRMSAEDGPLTGPRIAVINLDGIILDATGTVAWIEKVRRDDFVKGAVLRINSPGGAVGPSQELYAAVKRLDKAKPVVASMGALAASGGYYAALGAREIYASPSSLTASIGVKMQVPNFGELMKTIGISEKTLTTGKLKDAGSTSRNMTADEEAYFRALLGDMYEEFVQTVARERNLPADKVRTLADGRAMTGRQAFEAKLVDKLGDRYDAIRRVMQLSNLPDSSPVKIVEGPEQPNSMLKELMGVLLEIGMEQKIGAEQPVFMY